MSHNFKTGDVVRLKYIHELNAHKGEMAVVVPPSTYPEHLASMYRAIDRKDVHEYFIAVEWLPSFYSDGKYPENGFYSKERFELVTKAQA